jgi:hypothetical protein
MNLKTKENETRLFLFIILSCTVAVLIFISGKGFNWGDEGLYAVMSNPQQQIRFTPVNCDVFFKILYKYSNYTFDIRGLRLLRIALTFAGSFFLFLGTDQLARRIRPESYNRQTYFLFVILIGFLSGYTFTIQTPGYNEFSLLGIQVFFGSILTLMLKEKLNVFELLIFIVFTCFGFLLIYISKPTGIPFIIAFCGLVLLFDFRLAAIYRMVAVWIAIIAMVVFFPISNDVSISSQYQVYQILRRSGVSHSVYNIFLNLFLGITYLVISFGAGFFLFRFFKRSLYFFYAFVLLVVLLYIFDFTNFYHSYSRIENFYKVYFSSRLNYSITLLFGFCYGGLIREIKQNYDRNFFLLLSIPPVLFLASFFGTDGSFLGFFPKALQFFAISFLVFSIPRKEYAVLLASGFLFVKFMVSFLILNPTNQEPLDKQTYQISYGKDLKSSVYVDSVSYANQSLFTKIVSKYETPFVIGFDRLESYIYLANKRYPGSYLWGDEDLKDYFTFRFNSPDSVILVVKDKQMGKLLPYLKAYNIQAYDSQFIPTSRYMGSQFTFYICNKTDKQKLNP